MISDDENLKFLKEKISKLCNNIDNEKLLQFICDLLISIEKKRGI